LNNVCPYNAGARGRDYLLARRLPGGGKPGLNWALNRSLLVKGGGGDATAQLMRKREKGREGEMKRAAVSYNLMLNLERSLPCAR
jgi:hypothetical protein